MPPKKSGKIVSKRSAKKRTLNANTSLLPQSVAAAAGDPTDQDVKRRIGQYGGAGEPHRSGRRGH